MCLMYDMAKKIFTQIDMYCFALLSLTSAYVDYMDLAVRCSRKAVKLNHSLTPHQ